MSYIPKEEITKRLDAPRMHRRPPPPPHLFTSPADRLISPLRTAGGDPVCVRI